MQKYGKAAREKGESYEHTDQKFIDEIQQRLDKAAFPLSEKRRGHGVF
jgi:hypothetical protein